jgi:hypothetical protein
VQWSAIQFQPKKTRKNDINISKQCDDLGKDEKEIEDKPN